MVSSAFGVRWHRNSCPGQFSVRDFSVESPPSLGGMLFVFVMKLRLGAGSHSESNYVYVPRNRMGLPIFGRGGTIRTEQRVKWD